MFAEDPNVLAGLVVPKSPPDSGAFVALVLLEVPQQHGQPKRYSFERNICSQRIRGARIDA